MRPSHAPLPPHTAHTLHGAPASRHSVQHSHAPLSAAGTEERFEARLQRSVTQASSQLQYKVDRLQVNARVLLPCLTAFSVLPAATARPVSVAPPRSEAVIKRAYAAPMRAQRWAATVPHGPGPVVQC